MDSYFPHQENKATTSSSSPHWKHHVFTSFHGPDVRKGFLSHLLSEFKSKGIKAFVDNHMETSTTISDELIEAIRGSRIAIVMLSKNYASSTWCLNELVEIMECKKKLGQTVMSVFYEVDPTDIRNQTGYFGEVFKTTCERKAKEVNSWQRRFTSDDLQIWESALAEVAQIKGYHSTNWKNDRKMIKDIAIDVWSKLNNFTVARPSECDFLVGVESHMTKMGPLTQLDSDEVRTIGILGPSGIGKTTIARYLFNQHSQYFPLFCFMDNIKTKYATPACSDDYKLDLQKQLISQLTNEAGIKIPRLGILKNKVFLILDDVDRSIQLEAMANETWFGPGSRIIITTQDQKILKTGGIEHIYRVGLPSDNEALQMFCMYAFGQKSPKNGFRELASEVTSLVGKLPLGLRVMGSYFRDTCKEDWRKALPSLKTHLVPEGEFESILKFSYDGWDDDKQLFLYIACFFNDERVDIVEGCLASCFLDVTQRLRVLAEKSLISMDSKRIKMQWLLLLLGRNIVRNQSRREPGKHQIFNNAYDIGDVLNNDKAGGRKVLGIYLRENIIFEICPSERAFERLSNLRFLSIHSNVINPQSLNFISRKLRFLRWWEFPMPCFPFGFNPKFLVKLEMQNSKLVKLWEKTQPLSNLKWMDLSDSESLEELHDLSSATNLDYLNLNGCSSLVEIPSSIGKAINLKYLLLKYCKSLVKLPPTIGNAISLKYLYLSHCSSLVELPQLPYSVVELEADNCESLERLDCSFLNPGIRLNFLNCFKLNQEAKDLIIQTRTNQYAVLPGGEVPQCFTERYSGGSLKMKLNQSTSTRFKACIVYARDVSYWRKADISCSIMSKENALTSIKAVGQVFPGNMYTFEVEAEEVTATELVFEFKFHSYFEVELEIKECGILQFLEVPHADEQYESGNEHYESVDEDFGSGDEHYESDDEDYESDDEDIGSGDEHCESVRDGDEDYEPSHIEI